MESFLIDFSLICLLGVDLSDVCFSHVKFRVTICLYTTVARVELDNLWQYTNSLFTNSLSQANALAGRMAGRLGLRSKPRPNSSRRNCHGRPTISQAAKCSFPIVFLFATVGNCNLCDFAVPPQRRNLQSAWIPAKPKVYLWDGELTFELKVLRCSGRQTFFLFAVVTDSEEYSVLCSHIFLRPILFTSALFCLLMFIWTLLLTFLFTAVNFVVLFLVILQVCIV